MVESERSGARRNTASRAAQSCVVCLYMYIFDDYKWRFMTETRPEGMLQHVLAEGKGLLGRPEGDDDCIPISKLSK